jgi:CTD small phosphatase-like protein 2
LHLMLQQKEEEVAKLNETKRLATACTTPEAKETAITAPNFDEELRIIKACPHPSSEDITSRFVYLGPQTKKYTLLLDLDETLVHSPDQCLLTWETLHEVLEVRPGAQQLLSQLSRLYELVFFTAAEERYAREVLRRLDPEGKFVARLLTRKQCIQTHGGFFVKDLRIFADRSVSQMLIVDNNVLSFAFHLPHGIPIAPFYGAKDDTKLSSLVHYLEHLYDYSDLVQANKQAIGLVS